MPLHVRHEMAVEVKHVGILALVASVCDGTGWSEDDDDDNIVERTRVFFILQSPLNNAPLATYFNPEFPVFKDGGLLDSIMGPQAASWWASPTDNDVRILMFNRWVEGHLAEPKKFLHATADKLLKELREAEDADLYLQEQDDELNWANANYGSQGIPNFKRPRHVD